MSNEKMLMIVGLMCCFITTFGCKSTQHIPLSEGDVPYILAPGVYQDKDGVSHVEREDRWVVSMSEGDLVRFIEWLRSR